MQLRHLIAFIFRYILLIIHKFNKLMTYCYKNIKKLICFPLFLYLCCDLVFNDVSSLNN